MEDKQFIVDIPEGYEIDKENSTFECIKFKKIEKRWRDDKNKTTNGFYITTGAKISPNVFVWNTPDNYNVFATEKQAKSALAMARISQIMLNDKRFGGVITNEEWDNGSTAKHCIYREKNRITTCMFYETYNFLAFHTAKQRDLFFKENKDLIKDYLML